MFFWKQGTVSEHGHVPAGCRTGMELVTYKLKDRKCMMQWSVAGEALCLPDLEHTAN